MIFELNSTFIIPKIIKTNDELNNLRKVTKNDLKLSKEINKNVFNN